MTNEGICLDAFEKMAGEKNASLVRIVSCGETNRQRWTFDIRTQQIVQHLSDFCLTASSKLERNYQEQQHDKDVIESNYNISLSPCTDDKWQKWVFLPLDWK